MNQPVDYDELEGALRRCGSTWNVAQVHGLLCSRLAVEGAAGGQHWLQQVLEGVERENALRTECEMLLDTVYGNSYRQLAERQSDFELLVPDDESPAGVRADALAHWCEGFLHGLVSGRKNQALRDRLAKEPLAEVIKNLLEITRAVAEEDDETNDEAWVELVEFVRVAAQLAYEELADLRDGARDEGTGGTLH